MAELINGSILAESIKQNVKNTIAHQGLTPGLAIVLVGDNPASRLYVRLKKKAAELVGIDFHEYVLSAEASQDEVLETIQFLNNDDAITGIVLQLPLPEGLDEDELIAAIEPTKDADGFHPENISHLLAGESVFEPALTKTILSLLAMPEIDLAGKNALIVANADIFAKPLIYLLEKQNVSSSYTSPDDTSLEDSLKKADIVIVAVGKEGFIKDEDCKKDAIVIDIGINKDGDSVCGDVDKTVYEKSNNIGWVTPVPGGVGPVTIAMLLTNVLELYLRRNT